MDTRQKGERGSRRLLQVRISGGGGGGAGAKQEKSSDLCTATVGLRLIIITFGTR